ncbi:thiamine biosynthesis protein ApbE [Acidobacteria bacterium Mor1]|nr:thiamine biosynthesis protein ApbE [Acidobacteria bacterium Mor1]
MGVATARELTLRRIADGWAGEFRAMASPCEVLVLDGDRGLAREILGRVSDEAWRIEAKLSRYRDDNIIHRINHASGSAVEVDEETGRMLDFAQTLYELSEGRFDITSGVLRKVWKFDGSDRIPSDDEVEALLEQIGWYRVRWDGRSIALQPEMQIDLGGIGKEYAVDRAARLAADFTEVPCLVNFGGDLMCSRPRLDGTPWRVGIEQVDTLPGAQEAVGRTVRLTAGGLATSGDARRFLLKDGVRYPHILDPRRGRPVMDAPRSVTVAAATCTEAGMLATLAMLEGAGAAAFLEGQGATCWVTPSAVRG